MDRSEWVLVPRDVTPEMWEAGMNCHSPDDTQGDYLDKVWPAMLAAAPPPPAEQASGDDALAKLAEVLPPKPMPGDDYGFQMSPEHLRVLHDRFAALSQRPAEQASGEHVAVAEALEGTLRELSQGDLLLDHQYESIDAALAALSQRPVVEGIDWRWQFVHTSAMRYMDNGLAKKAAERAAEQDALLIEATSDKPARVSGGGDEAAQRDARTERELQRAAAELPDGYVIQVCVEKHAGWVDLVHPDGTTQPVDDDEASLATAVATALDAALAPQQPTGEEG